MTEPAKRLGDLIDDYCPRCRLLLNHAVASLVDGMAAKVICQTCFTEHPYRHGEGGKKKTPNAHAKLFHEVSARMAAPSTSTEPLEAAAQARQTDSAPAPRKRTANPARYISRHHGSPPRGKSPQR